MQQQLENSAVTGSFELFATLPAATGMEALAVSAQRAGATVVLDLEFAADERKAHTEFRRLMARGACGLRVTSRWVTPLMGWLERVVTRDLTLILVGTPEQQLAMRSELSGVDGRVICEVLRADDIAPLASVADGFVLRGHEAGGWVGDDTSFILLQKALERTDKPLFVQGGIGIHAAAACRVAGAAGVVLDDALLALAESGLAPAVQAALQRLSGIECRVYGESLGFGLRGFATPGGTIQEQLEVLAHGAEADNCSADQWRQEASGLCGWDEGCLVPVGQGIGMAVTYRKRYERVAPLLRAVRQQSAGQIRQAAGLSILGEDSPMALAHGTRFPLAQGPMTRVSDSAAFATEVAAAGGLPFLALALLKGPQVARLLEDTVAAIGGRPWGVGLLGFVDPELRAEQCAEVFRHKPDFALIAGGRPDQAESFAAQGIPAYLHAPSPSLLALYLEQGARRFVFEGRECGGHIGPLASFPLWEQMIEILLEHVSPSEAASVHVLFAGGIHDARSAAMVAAMAAPLAERGMKVGCLMGTAYLFTREIVESGAIVEGFQQAALDCSETVSLVSGPGHVTRCARSPFTRQFGDLRRQLLTEQRPVEDIRDALEQLNLGRLRVASKGRDRDAAGELVEVGEDVQRRDGMYMIGQVATLRGDALSIQELHENVCLGGQQRLQQAGVKIPADTKPPKPAEVAIVGIGVTLPGANSAEEFWQLILDQRCVIGEVPQSRWDWRQFYDADPKARDKVYSKWGGFVDQVPFDPIRYGIPPKSMKSIDPFQLLTLETAARTLADAGYADADFDRERTSVILGASGGAGDLGAQFALRAELPRFVENPGQEVWDRLPEWTEESFAGTLLNVAAGRVANRLDFGGVNYTVDAACGSSMAAVSLAVDELESGRSSMVLAGGFDTTQSAYAFTAFAKTQALSASGQIRTFDESADGIAISEGVVMVALKRLADAQRDGDRIYAVIKGAAGSSDGRALGLTAPRTEGQQRALQRAYERAGFEPSTLGLMEAHGTGTAVGDRTEVQSIADVLKRSGARPHGVAIGSVKTLLGHTKAAAGVSGLVKVALSLHHRVLPGHAGVTRPIEPLRDEQAPVYLLREPRPWVATPANPRRGGASAFGFGGTNFHAVLEEYPQHAEPGSSQHWPAELFVLRAADRAELAETVSRLVAVLQAPGKLQPGALAASLAAQAASAVDSPVVAALVASDLAGLASSLEALQGYLDGNGRPLPNAVRFSEAVPTRQPKLGFVFPGQGAQYVNMGREAGLYLFELREAIELADRTLADTWPEGLSRYLMPSAAFDAESEQQQLAALTATQVAQPAIGCVALGYLQLAENLGLQASACAGHSYGEYAALMAAGVLGAEDFLRLSAVRGRAMAEAGASGEAGSMAAVQAERDRVEKLIQDLSQLRVANHNAPEQVVLSGPVAELETAMERMDQAGLRASRLPVSGAFHTELVASARPPLQAAIQATDFAEPRIAVYGNGTARPYPQEAQAVREQLDAHLLGSVEFVQEIRQMQADGIDAFVELGPRGICSNMIRKILPDAPAVALDGNGGGMRGLMLGLAELLCAGVRFDLQALFSRRGVVAKPLESLLEETRPVELPAHFWLLSGGCARPVGDPVYRTGRLPPLNDETATQAREAARLVAADTPDTAVPPPPVAPQLAMPAGAAAAMGEEALVAYQQTMRQFLQLQEQVMARVLGGEGASPVADPVPVAAPVAVAPNPEQATVAPSELLAGSEPTAVPVARTGNAAQSWADRLLQVVAERTGYPPEMLELEADLEGDLGVDSIKRVEIIGALGKELPKAAAAALRDRMDELSSSRSLAAMLSILEGFERVGAGEPAALSADAGSAIDRRGVLMEVLAERTGYPPEMLAVDADLEADLGIDSIKRVEIIGALRQTLPPALGDELAQRMDEFSACRSIDALVQALDKLSGTADSSQPVTPDSDGSESFNLMALLNQVVSERTGYPEDLLDPDADLEADLGVDSIKRVEIIGALRQQLPAERNAALQGCIDELSRARSLRLLGEKITTAWGADANARSMTSPEAKPVAEQGGSGTSELAARPPRYVMQVEPSPLPANSRSLDGLAVILGPHNAIAASLAADLSARGVAVAQVEATDVASMTREIDQARATHGPLRYLVHLHGLGLPMTDAATALDEQTERLFLSLLYAIQASADELSTMTVLAASSLGGQFGRAASSTSCSALAGGLNGMLNCLRVEFPGICARAVDFADPDDPEIAKRLLAELECVDERPEVGYVRGQRLGSRTVARELEAAGKSDQLLQAGDVVLVTGGARGITATIANEIAVPGLRLILLGRTPLPGEEDEDLAPHQDIAALRQHLLAQARARGERPRPVDLDRRIAAIESAREIRRTLHLLSVAGAEAEYRPCDVRDDAAFGAVIDEIYERFGQINGVIHGAGVIEDKYLIDKASDSFGRVVGTKLNPAILMASKLRPEGLRFIAFFASVAGRYGNAGQADYAAANESLNRLAWQLRSRWPEVRVMSINWGPWAGGMASDGVLRGLRERGMEPIDLAAGCHYFREELRDGSPDDVELVVGRGPWGDSSDAAGTDRVAPTEERLIA